MTNRLLRQTHDARRDAVKGFQQPFGRGTGRLSVWVAGIENDLHRRLPTNGFKPESQQLRPRLRAFLFRMPDAFYLYRLLFGPHLLQPSRQQPGYLTHLGQRYEVEIPAGLEKSPRGQRTHLAVSDVQPAALSHHLSRPLDGRQVQPIIRLMTSHDQRGYKYSQEVQSPQHHLELGQVGLMIFAILVAEQGVAFRIIVHVRAGAIPAYRSLLQVIHPDQPLPQPGFYLLPRLIVAQSAQYIGRSIIGEALDLNRLRQQDLQGVQLLLSPRFDFAHVIVGFKEDVTESGRNQPAHARPLVIAVGPDHLIQHIKDTRLLSLMDQQRNVVYRSVRISTSAIVPHPYRNFSFRARNRRTTSTSR